VFYTTDSKLSITASVFIEILRVHTGIQRKVLATTIDS